MELVCVGCVKLQINAVFVSWLTEKNGMFHRVKVAVFLGEVPGCPWARERFGPIDAWAPSLSKRASLARERRLVADASKPMSTECDRQRLFRELNARFVRSGKRPSFLVADRIVRQNGRLSPLSSGQFLERKYRLVAVLFGKVCTPELH